MKRIFNPIHEKMILKRRTGSWNAPETLKEYSPWLSNFQASNYTYTLEIPGQAHSCIDNLEMSVVSPTVHNRRICRVSETQGGFGGSSLTT